MTDQIRRKMAFPPMPISDWPVVERQRFEEGTCKWGGRQSAIARIAWGYYRAFSAHHGRAHLPTVGSFAALRIELLKDLSPNTVRRYLRCIHDVAGLVRPDSSWDWMPAQYTSLTRTGRRQTRIVTRQDRLSAKKLDDWPASWSDPWLTSVASSQGIPALTARDRFSVLLENHNESIRAPASRSTLAPRTRALIERTVGLFLATLEDVQAQVRMDAKSFDMFIAASAEHVTPITLAGYANKLRQFAVRTWPQADWRWLHDRCNALRKWAEGEPNPKARRKIVGAVHLRNLALDLCRQAEAGPRGSRAAILFRDGLLLWILVALSPRRHDLASLRLNGKSLVLSANGSVQFAFHKTKNGDDVLRTADESLASAVRCWINVFRPRLASSSSGDAFWVALTGDPLSPESLTDAIRGRTRAAFGVPVSPQACRNNVASMLVEHLEARGAYALASWHLGHRSSSAIAYYTRYAPHAVAASLYHRALSEGEGVARPGHAGSPLVRETHSGSGGLGGGTPSENRDLVTDVAPLIKARSIR